MKTAVFLAITFSLSLLFISTQDVYADLEPDVDMDYFYLDDIDQERPVYGSLLLGDEGFFACFLKDSGGIMPDDWYYTLYYDYSSEIDGDVTGSITSYSLPVYDFTVTDDLTGTGFNGTCAIFDSDDVRQNFAKWYWFYENDDGDDIPNWNDDDYEGLLPNPEYHVSDDYPNSELTMDLSTMTGRITYDFSESDLRCGISVSSSGTFAFDVYDSDGVFFGSAFPDILDVPCKGSVEFPFQEFYSYAYSFYQISDDGIILDEIKEKLDNVNIVQTFCIDISCYHRMLVHVNQTQGAIGNHYHFNYSTGYAVMIDTDDFSFVEYYWVSASDDDNADDDNQKKNGGGGCSDCTPPTLGIDKDGLLRVKDGITINGYSEDGGYFHTDYPMQYTELGKINNVILKYWENSGAQGIKIVQLGIGIKEIGSPISESQALIEVHMDYFGGDIENAKIKEVIVIDSDNILNDNVSAIAYLSTCSDSYSLNEKKIDILSDFDKLEFYQNLVDSVCLSVDFEYSYDEIPKSWVLGSNAIDYKRNAINNYFNDGLTVIDPNPVILEDVIEEKTIEICKPSNVMKRTSCNFDLVRSYEIQKAELHYPDYSIFEFANGNVTAYELQNKYEGMTLIEILGQEK